MAARKSRRPFEILKSVRREPGYYVKIGKLWHRISTQDEANAAREIMTIFRIARAPIRIWTGAQWKPYPFQFSRIPLYDNASE